MRLSKLHGLGNDFLVLLDDGSGGPVAAERARALCHRRSGVGADGLLRAERQGDGTVTFHLLNADGSEAEMSGNGARCLGLAAARAGWWEDRAQPLVLRTPAGERALDWQDGDLAEAWLRVGMGEVRPTASPDLAGHDGGPWSTWEVDVGNPHTVRLIDGPLPPLEHLRVAIPVEQAGTSGATNHEFVVKGPEAEALTMVVHERGSGWTQACGTGSVAAAWAAHQEGWVGRLVTVHNPGGALQVDLAGPEAKLSGPATYVASVEVEGGRT